ncbi:AMP-binding protein [Nocardia terpenica]|uniref:AMP-binding protein n=1 Tax=Nocardia terpenica TaxID=455432 RepID=A0A6G9YYW8_9NOCA|nr:AMP-binding protein [Nocardia terpenica]QIS18317.1 AMP-binding protein [Nocardia terpenica]
MNTEPDTEPLLNLVLGDVLSRQARENQNENFLRFREGDLTYGEVDEMVNRVAQGLISLGIGPGQHVAVMVPNQPEILYSIFALATLGAVSVPINTDYHSELLRHVLHSSDATTLIIDSRYVDRIPPLAARLPRLERLVVCGADAAEAARRPLGKPAITLNSLLCNGNERPLIEVGFSDLQAIQYTSGTTGPSKGVMVSHAHALMCSLDSLNYLDRWGKTSYSPLPLYHGSALWDGVFSALLCGGSVGIVERFSASRFWDDVRFFRAEVAMSVFTMIPILLNPPPGARDRDHPLEMFYTGKSALDDTLRERFGVRSVETYSSAETGLPIASPYGEWRPGSMGRVVADKYEAAVVDERDFVVGPGVAGELVIRPKLPSIVMGGYYGAPEATAQCFRNMWLHTGDRVWQDEDGYFYFLDRMRDAIRRRGENISAFDLECEVNLHPAVLETAAIAVPSELGEDDVKLAVVLRPEAALAPDELIEFCAEKLPRFMVPRYVEFVDSLPRTGNDKVAKYLLRAQGEHGITPNTWDRDKPVVAEAGAGEGA